MNNQNEIFISYNLPSVLSKNETYDLIDKAHNGDQSSKNILTEHNIGLVLKEVNDKFSSSNTNEKKDLVSVGIIGLMDAIDKFDTKRSLEFSTYAVWNIDGAMYRFLRKERKSKYVDSLDRTIFADSDNEQKLKDIIYDNKNIMEEIEDKEIYKVLRNIVEELSQRENEIIKLYYGFYNNERYTQKEISVILGMSKSNVSKVLSIALSKISSRLLEMKLFESDEMPGKKKSMRNASNMYDYFGNSCSVEDIKQLLYLLSEEEHKLLTMKFGNDFKSNNRVKFTDEEKNEFYYHLIPKIKRRLKNKSSDVNKYIKK